MLKNSYSKVSNKELTNQITFQPEGIVKSTGKIVRILQE